MLRGPNDPLPPTTQRILVTGASGAGKSTLRQTISDILGLPTVELDSLHHGPGWTQRPSFIADVEQFAAGPEWVVEWQYAQVRPLLLQRADTLIWLDHSKFTVTQRVVRRTLHHESTEASYGTATVSRLCTRSSPTPNTSSAGPGTPIRSGETKLRPSRAKTTGPSSCASAVNPKSISGSAAPSTRWRPKED